MENKKRYVVYYDGIERLAAFENEELMRLFIEALEARGALSYELSFIIENGEV